MSDTTFAAGTVIASTWLNDVNKLVYKGAVEITISPYSASRTASAAANKTALQSAITAMDAAGGGTVIVPSGIDYGFVNNDVTTYPSFTGITNDVTVLDYGIGDADGSGNKAGAQYRAFFHTAQTTPFGMHDGNGHVLFGDWHPYYAINNTATIAAVGDPSRLATDNRRASIFFYNNGQASWRFGQGSISGATYTNEELSNFCLQHFQTTGDTLGDYNPLIIERATGNWAIGIQTNSPSASYHFKSNSNGGLPVAIFEGLTSTTNLLLRNSSGSGSDVTLKNSSGTFQISVGGNTFLTVGTNGAGALGTSLAAKRRIITYSTSMTIDAHLGNFFTITATNGTAFAINAPTDAADGQVIHIKLSNTSGGALGTITPDAVFKLVGGAWPSPTTGNSITITLGYDGANWHEFSRSGTVPN